MSTRYPKAFLILTALLGLLSPLMPTPVCAAPAFNVFFQFATNTSFVPAFPNSEPTVSTWSVTPGDAPWIVAAASSGGPLGHGRLVRIRADGSSPEDIVFFTNATLRGREPQGPLIEPGPVNLGLGLGLLFGTCRMGGTADVGCIFRVRNDGAFFQILRSFAADGRDGRFPNGGLTYFSADGFIYGTTPEGGTNNAGTLFRIRPDGTGYLIVRHFTGSDLDGRTPNGSLVVLGSFLFGTTYLGGVDDRGTLFRFQPSDFAYTVRWHFGSAPDQGILPSGGLLWVREGGVPPFVDALHGLASYGGTNQAGTLYRYVEIGESYQAFTVVKHFGATPEDARHPRGRLVLSQASATLNSRLVGVSSQGGEFNKGTVFAIGSNPEVLHSFGGGENDGELPLSGVTICEGVALGATAKGGRNDAGILFKVGLGYNFPNLLTNVVLSGSNLQFQLRGDPLVRYTVQSSPMGNPTNWTKYGTVVANGSGQTTVSVSATNSPSTPGRMFRFAWP